MKLRLMFFILIFHFSNGCVGTASFGSKGEILNQDDLQDIYYIELLPILVSTEIDNDFNAPNLDSIKIMLENEIKSRKLFQVISGKDKPLNSETKNNFLLNGAFLLTNLRYFKPPLEGANAEITLKLVRPASEKVILYCSHNTYEGNSYFLPPGVDEVTQDAIKGSIDMLEKLYKGNKK